MLIQVNLFASSVASLAALYSSFHVNLNLYHVFQIGQWHSHHGLQLYRPSGGDCKTVMDTLESWNSLHAEKGWAEVTHYVMCIATLDSTNGFKLHPHLFSRGVRDPVRMDLVVLKELVPLRSISSLVEVVASGSEDPDEDFHVIDPHPCMATPRKANKLDWIADERSQQLLVTLNKHM